MLEVCILYQLVCCWAKLHY